VVTPSNKTIQDRIEVIRKACEDARQDLQQKGFVAGYKRRLDRLVLAAERLLSELHAIEVQSTLSPAIAEQLDDMETEIGLDEMIDRWKNASSNAPGAD